MCVVVCVAGCVWGWGASEGEQEVQNDAESSQTRNGARYNQKCNISSANRLHSVIKDDSTTFNHAVRIFNQAAFRV